MIMDLAWEEYLRSRFCPPAEVLLGENSEFLKAHTELCPWCYEDMEAFRQLVTVTLTVPTLVPESDPPVRLGDLRRLRAGLSGWGEPCARYYNSPLVLVVEPSEAPEVVRVALCHDFPDLASEGDVELIPGCFAEPWNTFACPVSALEYTIVNVGGHVLEKVRAKRRLYPPRWNPFHHLEVQTAAFFAQKLLVFLDF